MWCSGGQDPQGQKAPKSFSCFGGPQPRAGEKIKTKLLVAQNGPFGTPNIAPEKVYVGPFFYALSQEMRHINSFSGIPKRGISGKGQKVYVEKVYVLSFVSGL